MQTPNGKDNYASVFNSFKEKESVKSPAWLQELQRDAFSKFNETGFPTLRNEDWKYTNVSPLVSKPFQFSFSPFRDGLNPQKVGSFLIGEKAAAVLVFVNGIYFSELSQLPRSSSGWEAGSLSRILGQNPSLTKRYLGKLASYDKNGFTALNTAFIRDGAFILFGENKKVERPIHLLFFAAPSEENPIFQPRNLVIAGKGSEATVIEHYISLSKDSYFTNAVTEIALEEESKIRHYKIQREGGEKATHVATTQVLLDRNSKYSSFAMTLGAKFSRENLNVLLDAEGAECVLDGLYLVSDGRHGDHHTFIDHLKPRGTSRQLYKGIVEGKSTAVFNGKILVHRDARKTDAVQTNKNLLLSDEATVDAKPQLEIFNDDVKCAHGEAIGQLDEEQLFYLRSRGIDEKNARSILTYAFASEVVNRAEDKTLQAGLDALLWNWLHKKKVSEALR